MKHIQECSVQDPWFTLIQSGLKTVEGRLNKGRFAHFKKNDIVRWFVKGTKKSCVTKVVQVVQYPSFAAMLQTEKLELVLPGIPDVESGVKVYRKFYTKEKENEFGVQAIRVCVLPNMTNRKRTRRS